MFVYYVWDGSHRDQSGKDTFFDESMELQNECNKNIFLSVLKVVANTHKHELQGIQWFFFIFSMCVGFVCTGLLHHLRALTERDGLCGKWMEVW